MNITSINCAGRLLDFSNPRIMGVLNVTPDSFYDGGSYDTPQKILAQFEKMVHDGADIIDIGAVSTRPGSKAPTVKEEIERLVPVLTLIKKEFPKVLLSVDTYRAEVLKIAHGLGADIANDISAGSIDPQYLHTVASTNMPYVLMHMLGKPENMQDNPTYHNVTHVVLKFFVQQLAKLKELGIEDVIIDPGFGFGKTVEQNYQLIKQLSAFRFLDKPILSGTSNKSMLYKVLEVSAQEILSANAILYYEALCNGASILRVHNVKEATEAIKVYQQLRKS